MKFHKDRVIYMSHMIHSTSDKCRSNLKFTQDTLHILHPWGSNISFFLVNSLDIGHITTGLYKSKTFTPTKEAKLEMPQRRMRFYGWLHSRTVQVTMIYHKLAHREVGYTRVKCHEGLFHITGPLCSQVTCQAPSPHRVLCMHHQA